MLSLIVYRKGRLHGMLIKTIPGGSTLVMLVHSFPTKLHDVMKHDVTFGRRSNPLRVVSLVSAGQLCGLRTGFDRQENDWDPANRLMS